MHCGAAYTDQHLSHFRHDISLGSRFGLNEGREERREGRREGRNEGRREGERV